MDSMLFPAEFHYPTLPEIIFMENCPQPRPKPVNSMKNTFARSSGTLCLQLAIYRLCFGTENNEIESLLSVENECKIKIFPRYYFNLSFHEILERFCWEQYLVEEFAELEDR